MTGAMYAAIGGLKSHMSNLNVIGNNIANVNTVGYKAQRMTFQESIYTMSKSGSDGGVTVGGNNPSQVGYGASVGSIDLNMAPGTYSPTGFGLDCMMMGEGFFAVGDKDIQINSAADLSTFTLTRVGDFWKDAMGYITDRAGKVAYGFQTVQNPFKGTSGYAQWLGYSGEQLTNVQGETADTIVSAQLGPMRMPMGAATPTRANGGLLDDGTTLWDKDDPVYDLMGPVMRDEDGNLFRGTVSLADIVTKAVTSVDTTTTAAQTGVTVTTLNQGKPNEETLWSYIDPDNPTSRVTLDKNHNIVAIEFANGTGRADGGLIIDNTANPPTSVLASAPANGTFTFPPIDANATSFAVTYDPANDAKTFPGYYRYTGPIPNSDGLCIEPSSMTVTKEGGISCQDSNGNTVVAGYLAVLSCASNDGVTHVGQCYYKAMEGAGSVRVAGLSGILQGRYLSNKLLIDELGDDKIPSAMDGILSGGTNEIKNAGLEASSTDIATEFSNMIITQRGYQANTRIVTVTDSMLEELVNMKR